MGAMKEIFTVCEDTCSLCQENRNICNGCVISVDLGDRTAYVNGITRQIIRVELHADKVSLGSFILDCMRVAKKGCLCFLAFLFITANVHAEVINVDMLADSIRLAENSIKYPYGIKSINTHGDANVARRICINTIKNNIKRYNKTDMAVDYITFLGSRYCPAGLCEMNKNWVKNVKKIYYNRKGLK